MFHFPASTPTQAMHSPAGNHTSLRPGFPIRTSSDQRFVGNSPRHNAASHVLHRLSMPHPHHTKRQQSRHTRACINARVHSPVLTHHTHTQPPTQHEQPHAGHTEHTQTNLVSAPQTPNSMPAKQNSFRSHIHQHETRAPFHPPVHLHPDFFFNRQQLHTRQHQPPHTTTNKHKAAMHNNKNSLERR